MLPRFISSMYFSTHFSPDATIIMSYFNWSSSSNEISTSDSSSHIIIVYFVISLLLWLSISFTAALFYSFFKRCAVCIYAFIYDSLYINELYLMGLTGDWCNFRLFD